MSIIDLVCERCHGDMIPHKDAELGFIIIACQKCGARKLTDIKTNETRQIPNQYDTTYFTTASCHYITWDSPNPYRASWRVRY